MTRPESASGGRPGDAPTPRIAVVGAGIAGLSCAFRLETLFRERRRPLALMVFDAAARPGGVIATERRDGFLVEAGPDCFIPDRPPALDPFRPLGLGADAHVTN